MCACCVVKIIPALNNYKFFSSYKKKLNNRLKCNLKYSYFIYFLFKNWMLCKTCIFHKTSEMCGFCDFFLRL